MASDERGALSDERLARIQDWLEEARAISSAPEIGPQWATSYAHDVSALMADNAHLRAELAAARERESAAQLDAAVIQTKLDSCQFQYARDVVMREEENGQLIDQRSRLLNDLDAARAREAAALEFVRMVATTRYGDFAEILDSSLSSSPLRLTRLRYIQEQARALLAAQATGEAGSEGGAG